MLFWSTISLFLFWLGYKYNILFVTDTTVDTRGLIYPRALKQLFAGIYLAEICMIGLFAVSKAFGPLVLMVAFLIFTVLFHLTMQKSLDPLMYSLPRTLEIEEELLQARATKSSTEGAEAEKQVSDETTNGEINGGQSRIGALTSSLTGNGQSSVQKKGNPLMKFLKPWFYADYQTLRALVPHEQHIGIERQYDDDLESAAYLPPSVNSTTPILWIPSDKLGVSKQEIAQTSKVIPISDEGATLDEKNHIIWDHEGARPPIWSEKIYY
jgi:hypothetical protein